MLLDEVVNNEEVVLVRGSNKALDRALSAGAPVQSGSHTTPEAERRQGGLTASGYRQQPSRSRRRGCADNRLCVRTIIPTSSAQAVPESWHWPEFKAARILHLDGWRAGREIAFRYTILPIERPDWRKPERRSVDGVRGARRKSEQGRLGARAGSRFGRRSTRRPACLAAPTRHWSKINIGGGTRKFIQNAWEMLRDGQTRSRPFRDVIGR